MKFLFTISLLIFSSTYILAQEQKLEKLSNNTIHEARHDEILTKINGTNSQAENKEKPSLTLKYESKNNLSQTDIDREIKAILDYRINRVLREDLFCLVCEAYSNRGQLA